MAQERELMGKTAFITGGSGSIGAATGRRLAADGAAVMLMARGLEKLQSTKADIEKAVPGAQVQIFEGDACEASDVQVALAQAYKIRKRLDIIVPTVGGGGAFRPLLSYDVPAFKTIVDRNLTSTFIAIRYGAPLMEHGGAIVCISATSARIPIVGLSAAACAKGAIDILVRQAGEELSSVGIRVNSVRPGLTRGGNTGALMAGDMLQKFTTEIPLAEATGRVGEPDDIAAAIRYLAGPESAWVTGQSFAVDGGQELRRSPDLSGLVPGLNVVEAFRAAQKSGS